MRFAFILLSTYLIILSVPASAQETNQSFSDVPPGSEIFTAVETLKTRGIIQGRPDGTFGSDEMVNRAEAVTIVVRAVANAANLPPLGDCFPDVEGTEWFVRPVCYAQDLEWVQGYPDGTFQPIRTVAKAEFLKILLNAYGVDFEAYMQFGQPLSSDVHAVDLWYFPYYAYAVGTAMTNVNGAGALLPGEALTRGQVALLAHRFLLNREKKHTQTILSTMETNILILFRWLEELNIQEAKYASARVQILSWAAEQQLPDNSLVRAGKAVSQSLEALTDVYDLTKQAKFESALIHAKNAFDLASEADQYDENVRVYTDKIRAYAHSLAESVRKYQEEQN